MRAHAGQPQRDSMQKMLLGFVAAVSLFHEPLKGNENKTEQE